MPPQDEAVLLLKDVINELTTSARDIKAVMRKCQHVCELLEWEPQKSWFHQEINGYYATTPIPAHRIILVQRIWEPLGSPMDLAHWNTNSFMGNIPQDDAATENVQIEIRDGIDWILRAAQFGYKNPTGKTRESRTRSQEITLRRVDVAPGGNFSPIITEIESRTFDFASKAYVQLNYGNVISGIWDEYRKDVDAGLQLLNLNKHLEAIQNGLASENPESWRTAVYECRNIFEDLANHLWQDPRKTYKYLPGRDSDGKPSGELEVKKGLFKNQLRAYIHQKGLGKKNRKFIQTEVDRLADSISSLISLQSKAHQQIRKQDALSTAIATYFVLGELIRRTDCQPVEEYVTPVKGIESE